MQLSTKKRPRAERGPRPRKDSSEFAVGPSEDVSATDSQSFRRVAKAFDASSDEDPFFTQFKKDLDTDKRKLLKTIQKRQQDAINADSSFRRQIRPPIADALRPRITATSAKGNAAQPKANEGSRAAAASGPAVAACPVAASGARILQLSKQLLASYEEAVKAIDAGGDRLKDAGGRLGDNWPKDIENLRGLLDIGYRTAQDDVVKVLQGAGDDDGDDDRAKMDAQEKEKADVFFGADREKQQEREQFNVAQSLCEASRGVRKLSESLPWEPESELLE
ncbi:hypothetical protein DIS24_g1177 [Lasiodiplodia hormozganensis]|uniref:Uncharacterized protein n=1 Tax=Lasiodiplodia hormozganensis TaxID=869390 RepID=A0AA39Z5E4_9PEZI|nr:hypothetical protein DIS24_g1177 [Lasiodiplodia hormozganensis]